MIQLPNKSMGDEINQHSQPIDICFRDISYSVMVEDKEANQSILPFSKKYKEKLLLDKLTGIIPAGNLTAIMGASGAGKTTLLNVLSCRIPAEKTTGSLTVNKNKYDYDNFGDFANYVMQKDVLIETLTVRETLEFAANLKLNLTDEEKQRRITTLVRKFKLEKCLDVYVGGHLLKGISGGEKKRTSIAFELISDPSVVVLDEPTSGLDSLTSFIIIRYLKQLTSKHGKTIFMTIHQPNSQIYQLFDRLILMIEGKFIYQGEAALAPEYFSKHFGLNVGEFMNPADYFMSVMHHESKQNRDRFPQYFEAYEKFQVPDIKKMLENERIQSIEKREVTVPFKKTMGVLISKDVLNTIRNPMLLKSRIFSTIFVSIFTSGVYYRFTGEYIERLNWTALSGFYFFMAIFMLMSALSPVELVFPLERGVFLKEEGSKLYSTFNYFLSRNIVELPASFIFPLLATLIMYWFVGLSSTPGQFFITYLIAYLLTVNGLSLGLLLGAMIEDQKAVAEVTPILLLPLVLFSGFFKNSASLPRWIGWVEYISPIKYGFSSWMQNEVSEASTSNIAELNFDTSMWLGIGLLIIMSMALRVASLFFLWIMRKRLE